MCRLVPQLLDAPTHETTQIQPSSIGLELSAERSTAKFDHVSAPYGPNSCNASYQPPSLVGIYISIDYGYLAAGNIGRIRELALTHCTLSTVESQSDRTGGFAGKVHSAHSGR